MSVLTKETAQEYIDALSKLKELESIIKSRFQEVVEIISKFFGANTSRAYIEQVGWFDRILERGVLTYSQDVYSGYDRINRYGFVGCFETKLLFMTDKEILEYLVMFKGRADLEDDKERAKEEEIKLAAAKVKEEALKKLSKAERKALGL